MIKPFLLAASLAIFASTAIAHSKLSFSNPENEAVLAVLPETMTLTFAQELRLTRVRMSIDDGKAIKLKLGKIKGFSDTYDIILPDSASGNYAIEWRGLGADGHPLVGEFSFTVQ